MRGGVGFLPCHFVDFGPVLQQVCGSTTVVDAIFCGWKAVPKGSLWSQISFFKCWIGATLWMQFCTITGWGARI